MSTFSKWSDNAKLTLRKADPSDSEFAYRVKQAAFKEYVEKVSRWDEDKQRQLHNRRFGAHDFRVINSDGTEVGIMAMAVAPDCVKVHQLFLLPEHQGKGIGAACVIGIVEDAAASGIPVRLQVLKVNRRAAAFFQRLGFTKTGESDTHVSMERLP